MKASKLTISLLAAMLLASCTSDGGKVETLKHLSTTKAPVSKANVIIPTQENAIENYRRYLTEPGSMAYQSQALRRLAALELERAERLTESGAEDQMQLSSTVLASSIKHYNEYLETHPEEGKNDTVLYQLSRAYSLEGDLEKQLAALEKLQLRYPNSTYIEEVQFRRAEIYFMLDDYKKAEHVYSTIASIDQQSKFATKAQYKLGWSLYKQERYLDSLDSFIAILDELQRNEAITKNGIALHVTASEKSFINDVLKVVSLALSYSGGVETLQQRYLTDVNRQYQTLLYQTLGDLYLEKERMADAAATFLAFAKTYALDVVAPEFHSMAINAFDKGSLHQQVLANKISYVDNYDVGTPYWNAHSYEIRNNLSTTLKETILELANYFHAEAIKSSLKNDYVVSSAWYRRYIASFPEENNVPGINFLIAECEFEAGRYKTALDEYVKTAYDYETHEKSAEAGYASIFTYDKILQSKDITATAREQLLTNALDNSIKFSYAFAGSSYAPAVITKTAETLFKNGDYAEAAEFSNKNMWLGEKEDKSYIKSIQLIYAHSKFEMKQYADAVAGYAAALTMLQQNEKEEYKAVSERLSASIYMQAQQYKEQKQYELAAKSFLRAADSAPGSAIVATAKYDAATMYVELEQWSNVITTLVAFRREFPAHEKLSTGVTEKLALSYEKSGQFNAAANELENLVITTKDIEEKRLLTWGVAEMYARADDLKQANNVYIAYINQFRVPFPEYIEAHNRVVKYYDASSSNNQLEVRSWLNKTVQAERLGADQRTDQTKYVAANALRRLAVPQLKTYESIELTVPLKASLGVKKQAMNNVLSVYKELMSYQIEEFTTEATYRVAAIYNLFSNSLLESQRPKGLSEEELEQYDILLEEQAYPFEEKAIDIHTSNIARTKSGSYDEWVIKSMEGLSVLQPIRYAKYEKNELYIKADY